MKRHVIGASKRQRRREKNDGELPKSPMGGFGVLADLQVCELSLARIHHPGGTMTRTTYARLAGFMFLFYIVTAITGMILFDQATSGEGIAAKLASIAQHVPQMRVAVVFSLLMPFNALVLAVALYAITRDQDPDLAVLALSCRVGEGDARELRGDPPATGCLSGEKYDRECVQVSAVCRPKV